MKVLKILSVILVLSFGIINVNAQIRELTEANASGSNSETGGFDKWQVQIGSNKYEFNHLGKGKKINAQNRSANFSLPIGKDEIIERKIYLTEYKNDLLALYEISVGGDGGAYIVRFNGTNLKPKWQANVSGFNIGNGLIENQFAYVNAIGFVGKIDLETGKYIWKHDGLYQKYKAFNAFDGISVTGNKVMFYEEVTSQNVNSITLDKSDGKIIDVKVN